MTSEARHQHEYQGHEAVGYEDRRTTDAKWAAEDRALVELLDLACPHPASVLDVPVGTGRFLPHYLDRGHTVVGVDISTDMLEVARAKVPEALQNGASVDGASVDLATGDVTSLAYGDDSFDLAVCVRLLNLVDVDVVARAVSELARVSRGHVLIGLRTYDPVSAPYQALRRAKDRLTGRSTKVVPHPAAIVGELTTANGLSLQHRVEIDRGARRSSIYHFYLFTVAGHPSNA